MDGRPNRVAMPGQGDAPPEAENQHALLLLPALPPEAGFSDLPRDRRLLP